MKRGGSDVAPFLLLRPAEAGPIERSGVGTTMPDHVQSNWTGVALVCRKCSKRVGGGFGPDERVPLAKALRALGNRRKGRKADYGVIETPCLKLCPKGRVVAIDARSPGRWLLVKPGTPVEAVAARLGLTGEAAEGGLLDR